MTEKDKILKRHENRADLAGEHKLGDAGQLVLLLVFLIVWIGDSFFLHVSTFAADWIPFYLRIPLALILLFGSGYFARSGLQIVFGETRELPEVIRKGVFNQVRHPIYLGSILFYFGLCVATLSVSSFVIMLVITAFYHFIAQYEEKLLLQKFGAKYEKYLQEVPMWLPQFKNKR
ncbi:MAG TPA: isoprenylcysteine carboxylmethyltransferase family protein [Bacteroidetes bacterium]|nr:isoprenylcysteine carboxylmethyltransferase family protein [Bacteroidota bacterium]